MRTVGKRSSSRRRSGSSQPGTLVRGKIVVDALALGSLARPKQWSHGNSEISRSAFLSPSRDRWSSSFDYSIFRLAPSRFIRADGIQRSGEEERTTDRKGKGRPQRASEETHGRDVLGRGEKARKREREGEGWRKGREEIKKQRERERDGRYAQGSFRYDGFARIPF